MDGRGERETLRKFCAAGDMAGAIKALPGHTEAAIRCMAFRKKLYSSTRSQWTDEHVAILRGNWGIETIETIARKVGRTRQQVWWKASNIGLDIGAPEGWEYFTNAADRVGYDRATLKNILRWADVKMYPAFSKGSGNIIQRHVVDSFFVDEAVRKWLDSETLFAAANARGVCDNHLLRCMKKYGGEVRRVSPRSKRSTMRASSSEWDRVLKMHEDNIARTELLIEAAIRYNVVRPTMRRWLRAYGYKKNGTHDRLDPKIVDAAAKAAMQNVLVVAAMNRKAA